MKRGIPAVVAAAAALVLLASCSQKVDRPDIVVVVLDTVRDDFTGPGGADPHVTPSLDALAAEGTVFTRACSNAPWTPPSHASMVSGLLPSTHGCTGMHPAFVSQSPTFAELLRDSGYETAAFFSNPWLTNRMTGVMRGFESRFVESGSGTEILASVDQGGSRTVANVGKWLDQRDGDRPFLMFVNLLEAHLPFDPPASYREEWLADVPLDYSIPTNLAHEQNAGLHPAGSIDFDLVKRLYAGDVNLADHYLGEVLALLQERGLYENAVIIVASDHGENLGDHGYMAHQFGVFSSLVDVPLVIRAPGLLPPGTRDDPVMLSDIYDTVLDAAGIDSGPDTPHSRSLFDGPAPDTRPQIAEYAGANPSLIRHLEALNPAHDTSRQKVAFAKVRIDTLELTVGSDGSAELYDLKHDPGRSVNLASSRPAVVGALAEALPAVERGVATEMEIDEEMRAWLRSLGYIQ